MGSTDILREQVLSGPLGSEQVVSQFDQALHQNK